MEASSRVWSKRRGKKYSMHGICELQVCTRFQSQNLKDYFEDLGVGGRN
jgi:hypothetical protein